VDFHPEHRAVAHALALALEDAGLPLDTPVRVYQVQVPLTAELVNLRVDIGAFEAQRTAALAAYASQTGSITSTERLRRYCSNGRGWVESFWQLEAGRYIALHREPPASWPVAFRGLRHFPLTDPLAWFKGGAARRRLAS
jgi:LmbE family N-acetylglucosaminyl deacetylase